MSLQTFIIDNKPRPSGVHDVHNLNQCQHLPGVENSYTLGLFGTCEEALLFARRYIPALKVDGCKYCSPECYSE